MLRQDIQKEADQALTRKTDEQSEATKQKLNQLRSKMHQQKAQDKLKAQIEYSKKHTNQEIWDEQEQGRLDFKAEVAKTREKVEIESKVERERIETELRAQLDVLH